MNFNKLRKYLSLRKISQRELADAINMSQTALSQAIIREDLKISTYKLICDHLHVPYSYFFTDSETMPDIASDVNLQYNNAEIEKLRESLREKDKIINDLRFTIDTMKLVLDLERRYNELNAGK